MNYDALKSRHAKLGIPAKESIVLKYLYEKVIGYHINDVKDVVRLAVLSYGWMPTMNKGKFIDNDIELTLIKDYLVEIQRTKSRQKAIDIAFRRTKASADFLRLTNNSVVGLSKALHIIRPDVFPIIDSHLLNGLRQNGKFLDFPKDKIPKLKHPTGYFTQTDPLFSL